MFACRLPDIQPVIRRTLVLFALVVATFPVLDASARQVISGRVLDAETDESVPFAHVFIDGTAIGDVAAEDGTFRLKLPPFFPFRLIVSMIGYEETELEIRTPEDAGKTRTIHLQMSLTELGEFVVEAEQPRGWRRSLSMLRDILFSTTEGGLRCEMVNPEVLDLEEKDGLLTASAPVPLEIVNPWLGYRITLYRFRFSGNRQFFHWTGRIQFTEMEADERQAERYRERRNEAWKGSMRHFLRALVTDRVPQEGFDAGLVDAPGQVRGAEPVQEAGHSARTGASQIVFGDRESDSRSVLFPDVLMVRYVKAVEPAEYARHMRSIAPDSPLSAGRDAVQTSWLQLPYGLAIVDTLGNTVTDGSAFPLSHYGFWAWKRLGDLLPADWLPE